FPVCTPAGGICEIVISCMDITTEQMNEAQVQLAMETSGVGLWQYNMNTQQFVATEQWKRLFGLPPDAAVTYNLFLSLVHPDDRAQIAEIDAQACVRHTRYEAQFRIIRPDGSLRWLTSQLQSIADFSNYSCLLIGSAMDITRVKAAEEQIS